MIQTEILYVRAYPVLLSSGRALASVQSGAGTIGQSDYRSAVSSCSESPRLNALLYLQPLTSLAVCVTECVLMSVAVCMYACEVECE